MAKNYKLLETGFPSCLMLPTILFGIVTHKSELIQAQRYRAILLTTRNDDASATLLHPVFNNLEQLINFGLVQNNQFACDHN